MLKCLNDKSGFTFVETLVTISIFTIIMLAMTAFFTIFYKKQAVNIVKIEGTNVAGRALEKMSNEIRKMNRAEDGTFAIELADEQNFIYYSDVDNDGLTERIEYFLNGTDLERKLIEPGVLMDYSGEAITTFIASHIKNGTDPIFKYYDENYTGSEDPLVYPVNVTQIEVVGIYIDINLNEEYPLGLIHAKIKIHPRNLKTFD